jgi:hypothetical protein
MTGEEYFLYFTGAYMILMAVVYIYDLIRWK